jgi:hypothetical protein
MRKSLGGHGWKCWRPKEGGSLRRRRSSRWCGAVGARELVSQVARLDHEPAPPVLQEAAPAFRSRHLGDPWHERAA